MGKGAVITGGVLLAIGTLLVLIGVILSVAALGVQEKVTVATEDDFELVSGQEYELELFLSLTTELFIEIESGSIETLEFGLRVQDELGEELIDVTRTTPYSYTLDLSEYLGSGTFTFSLRVISDNSTIDDLIIDLAEEEPSDTAVGMCCMGMVLPGTGVILAIVGIVLIIVGLVRKAPKAHEPDWSAFNRPQDIYQTPRTDPSLSPFAEGHGLSPAPGAANASATGHEYPLERAGQQPDATLGADDTSFISAYPPDPRVAPPPPDMGEVRVSSDSAPERAPAGYDEHFHPSSDIA